MGRFYVLESRRFHRLSSVKGSWSSFPYLQLKHDVFLFLLSLIPLSCSSVFTVTHHLKRVLEDGAVSFLLQLANDDFTKQNWNFI